jgi:putative ABC transport system substrate-binding protein
MRRRKFIILLGGAAAAWPFVAIAQQPKHIPRLCFLTFDPGTLQSTRFDAFFKALRDLGYADGQTITIDYLSADGHGERFPALAEECLRLKADIIALSTSRSGREERNPDDPDRHDRTWRSSGNGARRQPRQTWGKCHRDVDDGPRACGQAS